MHVRRTSCARTRGGSEGVAQRRVCACACAHVRARACVGEEDHLFCCTARHWAKYMLALELRDDRGAAWRRQRGHEGKATLASGGGGHVGKQRWLVAARGGTGGECWRDTLARRLQTAARSL